MADVKPAASAAAPPAQTSNQPPRYIPGAPAPTSKPKTKRKKPTPHGGTEPTVTKTDTPVALLSQVPSVSDLPSELVGAGSDTKEISASRPKSAAEEMVSKRMKLLGKKIQRFKAYKEKDPSTLNPDQVAAISSLPALEASYRELDDVAKALETVEIEQERKRAEMAAEVEARIDAGKVEAVQAYKIKVLPVISSLVGVHSALHPKDNSASTFIPPVLPPYLQDISADDVKKVNAMFETVAKGELEAIDDLFVELETIKGSYLYNILTGESQPAQVADEDAPVFSPQVETTDVPELANGSTQADVSQSIHDTVPKFGSFEYGAEIAEAPVSRTIEPVTSVPAQMSFMQSSELDDGAVKPAPLPEDSAPDVEASAPEQEQEVPEAVAQAPAAPATLDWTADDDDDVPSAQHVQDAFAQGSQPASSGVATPAIPAAEPEPSNEAPPQKQEEQQQPTQRSSGFVGQKPRRGGGQGQGQRPAPQNAQPNGSAVRQANVDEDGFQIAGRKPRGGASGGQPSGRASRGRGGQGAGGAQRGRGDGRGGRGGPGGDRGIRGGYAARRENLAA